MKLYMAQFNNDMRIIEYPFSSPAYSVGPYGKVVFQTGANWSYQEGDLIPFLYPGSRDPDHYHEITQDQYKRILLENKL